MILSNVNGVNVEAISACVPFNEIDNNKFARENFNKDFDSTIRAIGTLKRRVCKKETTTSLKLSIIAAEKIFKSNKFSKDDFGAIVFVTFNPEKLMPNNATYAQHLLGLNEDIAAFDINQACSGYVYGLWNAAMLAKNINKKVLLLDGDVNSHYISPWDKSTALLFGDAGTATVVSPNENSNKWDFTFITDGSNRDALVVNLASKKEHFEYKKYDDGSKRRFVDMYMDGERIFNYVVLTVPKVISKFLKEIEMKVENYDSLVLHQANAFMLRKLARKINFPLEKVPMSIGKYGNTSSASIPLNICSELNEEITQKSTDLLLCGMGAGLSTGIASININNCYCPGVLEVKL